MSLRTQFLKYENFATKDGILIHQQEAETVQANSLKETSNSLRFLRKRKARHNSMNYILYLRNLVIVVEFLYQLFHEQLNLDFCPENDTLESVSLVLLLNALLMKI